MHYDVRYAEGRHGHIAYTQIGDGPIDLVAVTGGLVGFASYFDEPGHARFFERLAASARVLIADPLGIGMSDPIDPSSPPTFDDHAADTHALLDAAGIERAAIFGTVNGVPVALLFAHQFPERVTALVLMHGAARFMAAPGYNIGAGPEVRELLEAMQDPAPAEPVDSVVLVAPSRAHDPAFRDWFDRAGRRGASPATARVMREMMLSVDVRHILTEVLAPTLVLHRRDNAFLTPEFGRYIAAHMPNARFVELPGADQMLGAGDVDVLADEITEFVTGVRPVREPDRVLATLLFTDLVDSTRQRAEAGDERWKERQAAHDAAVRRLIDRFGGREIKTMGDGFLILFTSPARAIACATAVGAAIKALGLEVRAGLHTGEVELVDSDVQGLAVAIAARVSALAGPGEVLVSGAIPPLVAGSLLVFEDRGVHDLKGVPGRWSIHAVVT